MQPDPLFQSFDAGWLLIIVGVAAIIAIAWWHIRQNDEPVHDDDDWDTEPYRYDPEADARHWPL